MIGQSNDSVAQAAAERRLRESYAAPAAVSAAHTTATASGATAATGGALFPSYTPSGAPSTAAGLSFTDLSMSHAGQQQHQQQQASMRYQQTPSM